jgi:hypothetical protein
LAGDFFAAVLVAAGTCASWVMKPDTASELSASVWTARGRPPCI